MLQKMNLEIKTRKKTSHECKIVHTYIVLNHFTYCDKLEKIIILLKLVD